MFDGETARPRQRVSRWHRLPPWRGPAACLVPVFRRAYQCPEFRE